MIEKSLELRKKMNKKRPDFNREDYNKKARIKKGVWRKPKGIHSKSRHSFRGNFALVKPGYRNPKCVRGLHPTGLIPILVKNTKILSEINPKTQGVIIGKTGIKKKTIMLNECKSKGITVLNFKNIDDVLKKYEDKKAEKKQMKEKKQKEKKISKEKTKKKIEEVKKEETTKNAEETKEGKISSEDKKKEEVKNMEKILTRRTE